VVTTHTTFLSGSFQARLQPWLASGTAHHLLIADEVHNLGAERIKEVLPDEIAMRLGLSATPERHYDPVGTAAVLEYFGGVVYEYPLSQAIAEGRLCRYRYYPVPVELTDNEADAYQAITTKLARFLHGGEAEEEVEPAALQLLMKRARLLAGAVNKLAALDQVTGALPEPPRQAIFYCGDGRTTDAITADEVRQIQAVAPTAGGKARLAGAEFHLSGDAPGAGGNPAGPRQRFPRWRRGDPLPG
jgi:superfamily II DNA or RNA helicase